MCFLLNEGSLNVTTYFQILLLGILWHGTLYLFSDINQDAVTTTLHVSHFLNFRLAQLIVLRRDLFHLIYLVIFDKVLVFNFPFLIPNTIISFSPDKYSLLIFNVVLHYELNTFKIPKMV